MHTQALMHSAVYVCVYLVMNKRAMWLVKQETTLQPSEVRATLSAY